MENYITIIISFDVKCCEFLNLNIKVFPNLYQLQKHENSKHIPTIKHRNEIENINLIYMNMQHKNSNHYSTYKILSKNIKHQNSDHPSKLKPPF